MRAGGLRQRMVIEEDRGTTGSAIGGRTQEWQPLLNVRVRAAFKGGREFERASQISADLTTLFIIRYDSRLDTRKLHAMRLRSLDDGSVYRILYADDPDHRRRNIHLHASESQSA